MNLQEAHKLVLEDLQQCNMFKGIYDAKNGNVDFMYGIRIVIEWIASKAGDEEFDDIFIQNMIKSKERSNENSEKKICSNEK